MKYILAFIAAAGLVAGTAYAGCGKKETTSGKLESYNEAKKEITIAGEKPVKLTLTPGTKIAAKGGKDADINSLVGKTVTVVSEHKKVETVTGS